MLLLIFAAVLTSCDGKRRLLRPFVLSSLVTSSEKRPVITNWKSTMGFTMSLRRTAYVHYVAPKLPNGPQKRSDCFNQLISINQSLVIEIRLAV